MATDERFAAFAEIETQTAPGRHFVLLAVTTFREQRHAEPARQRQLELRAGRGRMLAAVVAMADIETPVVGRVPGEIDAIERTILQIAAFPADQRLERERSQVVFAADAGARDRRVFAGGSRRILRTTLQAADAAIEAQRTDGRVAPEQMSASAEKKLAVARADHAVELQAEGMRQRHCQRAGAITAAIATEHAAGALELEIEAGNRRQLPWARGRRRTAGRCDLSPRLCRARRSRRAEVGALGQARRAATASLQRLFGLAQSFFGCLELRADLGGFRLRPRRLLLHGFLRGPELQHHLVELLIVRRLREGRSGSRQRRRR